MINLSSSDERIKKLIKKDYDECHIAVDDLFTLSLKKCKQSKVMYTVICEELVFSKQAKELADFYGKVAPIYAVSKKVYDRLCEKGNTSGIVVYTQIEQLDKKDLSKLQNILVCDGIEISGNIGTIFRTADATKIDAIIFTNLRAKVYDDKVLHASRGMIFEVPFAIMDLKDVQQFLKQNGFTSVLCEPEQGVDYKQFEYKGKKAYIVGSERYGADKSWFKQENVEFLKIPMDGVMDSLNVGVAASLIMYEVRYGKGTK